MKQFLLQRRHSIWAKALYSSSIISFSLYIIIRTFSFEFPMTWADEIILFAKVILTGTSLMSIATVSCAGLYRAFENIKRRRKTL